MSKERPYLYLTVVSLLILAINDLPYLFFLDLGIKSSIVIIAGAYLALSLILRNLVWPDRLSPLVRLLWVFLDTLLWAGSMRINGWDLNFGDIILAADAVMIGWRWWWGLPAITGVAAITMGVRALDWPGAIHFWVHLGLQVGVGLLLVHSFVYPTRRALHERYLAKLAQDEAEAARQALAVANEQLRERARQVEDLAILRERNRIAHEVHDTIAHAFTGIIMQLEATQLLLPVDPARASAKLEALQEKARESLDEVRRSVHALRPARLEARESTAALTELVAELRTTTGIDAEFVVTGSLMKLDPPQELCLYRAAQEGLTNALRHGRASWVQVVLTYGYQAVSLCVRDNGPGPTPDAGYGLGLIGIRERAEALGGTLRTGSAPGGGFELILNLPMN